MKKDEKKHEKKRVWRRKKGIKNKLRVFLRHPEFPFQV